MIRTFAQKDVEDLAAYGSVPVINGLTDAHHPCQAFADAFTIREQVGRLEGVRLVYSGDGNNVAHSLAEVGAKTGMHVVICSPPGYLPSEAVIERARADAAETGATIELTSDLRPPPRAPTSSTPTPSRAWARRPTMTCASPPSGTTR